MMQLDNKRSGQNGAAMLEMVVSLFVLAVGLLGSLAMQANSVKSNQRGHLITEANLLAADMVDRILAYDNIDDDTDNNDYSGIDTSDSGLSEPGDCFTTGCGAADQIAWDAWEWKTMIEDQLPGGIGQVSFADNVYTIRVMWDHMQNGATGTNCTGAESDLACFTFEMRL